MKIGKNIPRHFYTFWGNNGINKSKFSELRYLVPYSINKYVKWPITIYIDDNEPDNKWWIKTINLNSVTVTHISKIAPKLYKTKWVKPDYISDVLPYKILGQIGGIFIDFDMLFFKKPLELIDKYDMGVDTLESGTAHPDLLFSIPNSDVLSVYDDTLDYIVNDRGKKRWFSMKRFLSLSSKYKFTLVDYHHFNLYTPSKLRSDKLTPIPDNMSGLHMRIGKRGMRKSPFLNSILDKYL